MLMCVCEGKCVEGRGWGEGCVDMCVGSYIM